MRTIALLRPAAARSETASMVTARRTSRKHAPSSDRSAWVERSRTSDLAEETVRRTYGSGVMRGEGGPIWHRWIVPLGWNHHEHQAGGGEARRDVRIRSDLALWRTSYRVARSFRLGGTINEHQAGGGEARTDVRIRSNERARRTARGDAVTTPPSPNPGATRPWRDQRQSRGRPASDVSRCELSDRHRRRGASRSSPRRRSGRQREAACNHGAERR
jgi:hypothetical protein